MSIQLRSAQRLPQMLEEYPMSEEPKVITSKSPSKLNFVQMPVAPAFAKVVTFEKFVHHQKVSNPLQLNDFLFYGWGDQDGLEIEDLNCSAAAPWPGIGIRFPRSGYLIIQVPDPTKVFTFTICPDPPPTALLQFRVELFDKNGEMFDQQDYNSCESHKPRTIVYRNFARPLGLVGLASSAESVLCRVQSLHE
jgi:hypothetical protein